MGHELYNSSFVTLLERSELNKDFLFIPNNLLHPRIIDATFLYQFYKLIDPTQTALFSIYDIVMIL